MTTRLEWNPSGALSRAMRVDRSARARCAFRTTRANAWFMRLHNEHKRTFAVRPPHRGWRVRATSTSDAARRGAAAGGNSADRSRVAWLSSRTCLVVTAACCATSVIRPRKRLRLPEEIQALEGLHRMLARLAERHLEVLRRQPGRRRAAHEVQVYPARCFSPSHSSMAVSTTFSSSRTLPGQCVDGAGRARGVRHAAIACRMRWLLRVMKWLTSSASLSRRSRSGGRWSSTTFRRWKRSSRNERRCTLAARSTLVAVITRTSERTRRVPPRRRNSRSCRTRSSLACVVQRQVADLVQEERPAIVPARTPPRAGASAPVNAPRS